MKSAAALALAALPAMPSASPARVVAVPALRVADIELVDLRGDTDATWGGSEQGLCPSFQQKLESSDFHDLHRHWIPAFAGMTACSAGASQLLERTLHAARGDEAMTPRANSCPERRRCRCRHPAASRSRVPAAGAAAAPFIDPSAGR
jgi:hypothetical protein